MKNAYSSPRTSSDYLESRVSTASSADLQLMLLDGAVRFGRKAEAIWDDESQTGEVHQLLTRVVDVLEALTMGVAESTDPIAEKLEEQYVFVLKEFAFVLLERDRARFDRAMKLLCFERETWQMGCERAKNGGQPAPTTERTDQASSAPRRTQVAPIDVPLPGSGFSVQA